MVKIREAGTRGSGEGMQSKAKEPKLNEHRPLILLFPGVPAYSLAVVSSNAGFTGGMMGSSGNPMTASTIR